jgi:hypothetical protein
MPTNDPRSHYLHLDGKGESFETLLRQKASAHERETLLGVSM